VRPSIQRRRNSTSPWVCAPETYERRRRLAYVARWRDWQGLYVFSRRRRVLFFLCVRIFAIARRHILTDAVVRPSTEDSTSTIRMTTAPHEETLQHTAQHAALCARCPDDKNRAVWCRWGEWCRAGRSGAKVRRRMSGRDSPDMEGRGQHARSNVCPAIPLQSQA